MLQFCTRITWRIPISNPRTFSSWNPTMTHCTASTRDALPASGRSVYITMVNLAERVAQYAACLWWITQSDTTLTALRWRSAICNRQTPVTIIDCESKQATKNYIRHYNKHTKNFTIHFSIGEQRESSSRIRKLVANSYYFSQSKPKRLKVTKT